MREEGRGEEGERSHNVIYTWWQERRGIYIGVRW